ncbi:MAG: DUF808 domain-containing protein [Polyangiaceae bacterium]|nr:DUF808 domain-containing protein [Polyangiaceae bacterium]
MPASGLLALLDDLATIADDVASMAGVAARKGAAVGDDVATLTATATKKTSGIVTDDMAVTAEQAIGIPRDREIPVVLAVAKGSFRNKALLLAPGALALNALAPWAIHPVLMAGGAFLCFEGVEKVLHKLRPPAEAHADGAEPAPTDAADFERRRVAGAIRTDLILSGEIIALTLGVVAQAPFVTQFVTLYAVSVVMTVGVYGLVAGIVKLDDLGEALASRGGVTSAIGRWILRAAPRLLQVISVVGTVAMLMVGGHILLEGIPPVEHAVHAWTKPLPGVAASGLGILADIVVGVLAGLLVVGVQATGVPAWAWRRVRPAARAD